MEKSREKSVMELQGMQVFIDHSKIFELEKTKTHRGFEQSSGMMLLSALF